MRHAFLRVWKHNNNTTATTNTTTKNFDMSFLRRYKLHIVQHETPAMLCFYCITYKYNTTIYKYMRTIGTTSLDWGNVEKRPTIPFILSLTRTIKKIIVVMCPLFTTSHLLSHPYLLVQSNRPPRRYCDVRALLYACFHNVHIEISFPSFYREKTWFR